MRNTCPLLIGWLLLALPLGAQFTGRIAGSVLDASGAAVPGADVAVYLAGGSKPVLAAKTTADGLFNLIGVRPTYYDLTVEAPGFVKATIHNLAVYPARETAVPQIKLELPAVTTSIDVTANAETVQTGNAEISGTVTMEQVRRLPVLDRDPLWLIQTQAGVVSNANAYTVINGQRTSYANVTLDGINIQDNFIRDNGLDYTPNMLLLGQVSQFTIVTSNSNSAAAGGSAQVAFETPSGTNQFRGSLYWYNRNTVFSANDWFNNASKVERPFLNQNQLGGALGGPLRKDKLLFYTNYEAYRQRQQSPATRMILTSDARQGIFTYRDSAGNVRKADLLALRKVSADPTIRNLLSQVPGPDKINTYELGDSQPALLRNTAGYRFNVRDNRTRDNVTARIDYILSTRHVFYASHLWNRDNVDRPDLANDFALIPKVTNTNHSHFLSTTWRWTPSARLTNELRGGFNLAPGDFPTAEKFGAYILDGMNFSNPVNTFVRQGRDTDTYSVSDNASYQRGRHNLQFGFHMQQIRVGLYDDAGIIPTYYIGMGAGNPALRQSDLPGIRSTDLSRANGLLATIAGYITSDQQWFNVTSRTSGFVPNASYVRHYGVGDCAWYLQDSWRVLPRLTATLGLRYTLPGVVNEQDSLVLAPALISNDPKQTLLSNATLNFIGSSAGRPWYNRDGRDFAPNVGLAWDPFGNGRTALRAGYAISYVNDELLYASQNILNINAGLSASSADYDLTARISTGLPKIVTPQFQVPRTFADNYDLDPANVEGLINPNLRTPYVQQWSFGIQHQIKGAILEARYVGNHSTRGFRAFDYNQVIIKQNGFLADFLRARNNGFLALARSGVFNPAYNSAIPGSLPLTVFPKLFRGGQLNNATYNNLILTGQPGELAAEYQIYGENGTVNFFQNPYGLGMDLLTNYSNSTYNSLQVELRRRTRSGLDFQANYTFSKVLSDSANTSATRIEHFLDSDNPRLERACADFDLTHMLKATAIYDLPFGKGRRLNYRPFERALSGWSLSGFMTWQSGSPFSVLSSRGTLNRSARSYYNTAKTALTKSQLDNLLRFRMTGDGPFFLAGSAINPADGAGVSGDGETPFQGQVFFHPDPGALGSLQRRMFSGPWTFNLDFGIQKNTHLTERQSVEFRMEGANILNHATFTVWDLVLDDPNFGRITSTFYNPRVIQFGLYYRF